MSLITRQVYFLGCDYEYCETKSFVYNDPRTLLDHTVKAGEWLEVGTNHYCADHVCWCASCENVIIPWTESGNICDNCLERDHGKEEILTR